MAKKNDDLKDGTIIDLDADQVIEQVELPKSEEISAPVDTRKPRRGLIVPGVALLAGAIGGGWFYKDVLANYFPSAQTQALADKISVLESNNASLREQFANLDRRSAQLVTDIDALQSKTTESAGLVTDLQSGQVSSADKFLVLEQNLADLRKVAAELAARPAATGGAVTSADGALLAVQNRVDALEKDVASLKTKPPEAPHNSAALSQSLSDLKAKVAGGSAFGDELTLIQRMVPSADGLDVLQRHAAGIPDAKGLADELTALATTLPKPVLPAESQADGSWWGTITDSLSDVITIRSTGEPDWPATAMAVAATAGGGDLEKAIEQLTAVEGAKPAGLQQWQERAQARLSVNAAIQSVEDAVLRVVATKAQ